ncbi:hypothetical protein C8R45DRAFT_935394 [Mycena sanguinolenta]|nr:hypothetical protein C8R45DRAFT_935394 [Mycena sanguinolenta]
MSTYWSIGHPQLTIRLLKHLFDHQDSEPVVQRNGQKLEQKLYLGWKIFWDLLSNNMQDVYCSLLSTFVKFRSRFEGGNSAAPNGSINLVPKTFWGAQLLHFWQIRSGAEWDTLARRRSDQVVDVNDRESDGKLKFVPCWFGWFHEKGVGIMISASRWAKLRTQDGRVLFGIIARLAAHSGKMWRDDAGTRLDETERRMGPGETKRDETRTTRQAGRNETRRDENNETRGAEGVRGKDDSRRSETGGNEKRTTKRDETRTTKRDETKRNQTRGTRQKASRRDETTRREERRREATRKTRTTRRGKDDTRTGRDETSRERRTRTRCDERDETRRLGQRRDETRRDETRKTRREPRNETRRGETKVTKKDDSEAR